MWKCWTVFLLLTLSSAMAAETPKWEFRSVTGQVLDVDGKPAPGVTASLVGLDRDALYQINDDRNAGKWRFVTDAKGCFTTRFGNFRSIDYEKATGQWMPGWGGFYFVAERKGTAGGVSPYLKNEGGEYRGLGDLPQGEHNEWRTGEFQPVDLSQQPARFVIRLKRGITVAGRITDPVGNPLRTQIVAASHDLYAWSHTGHGAEILTSEGVTNRKGQYRIEHVFPTRFYLNLEPVNSGYYWFKTRLRNGAWQEGRVDEIQPGPDETEVRVDMILVKEPPYRYFGKVTDANGRGVPGAKVQLGVSLHWPERTHEDSHNFESATTDAKGFYEIRVESPFVGGFAVEAPGFIRDDRWAEGEGAKPFAPGKYDFQLKKE